MNNKSDYHFGHINPEEGKIYCVEDESFIIGLPMPVDQNVD